LLREGVSLVKLGWLEKWVSKPEQEWYIMNDVQIQWTAVKRGGGEKEEKKTQRASVILRYPRTC